MKAGMLTILLLFVTSTALLNSAEAAWAVERTMSPNPTATPSPGVTLPIHVPYDPFSHSETLPTYSYSDQSLSSFQRPSVASKPAGIDLDATYISRTPLCNRYEVWYADGRPYLRPGTENDKRWPDQGEVVTFAAHFVNKGTLPSGSFEVKWYIDGSEVSSTTHNSLAPGEEGTETYQWAWAHTLDGERLVGQHTVRFTVDPANTIAETYEANNSIEDRTDAVSLVLALTPELYEALETPVDPQWPYSAEDWLQKQIAAMNAAFARSIYPSTPSGIETRVRLDKILVTSTNPPTDWNEDGGFYMQADDRFGNAYYAAETDVSGGLIHELTHQLGIIDMYNLDVSLEVPQVLDRLERPVQMEYSTGSLFPGLMNNPGITPPIYDEHTTLAMNTNKGYRRGYYGEYLYDVPQQTQLRVLDNQGDPAAGVTVSLYQRSSDQGLYGGRFGTIDNVPEITGVTDAAGLVLLPNRSVGTPTSTKTGHTLRDNPFAVINVVGNNDEFILELAKGIHQEYRWLTITEFNLAVWRGAADATVEIESHVPPDDAPASPLGLSGIQESGLVKLEWCPSSSADVVGYNVYRAGHPVHDYHRVVTSTAVSTYAESYVYISTAAAYAVTAVDAQGRESGFSDFFYAFRLINPAAIAIEGTNGRIVLDPQNGYALLYQSPDGTFADTRSSYDYHLEYSFYLVRDSLGRLIISHPGDYYTTRDSVRVFDEDFVLSSEFGETGSAAGQFQGPAGVAVWGQPCGANLCRFLVSDSGNNRIQVFDERGAFVSTYGIAGTGNGQFNNPQGLAVDSSGNVIVADSSNNRLQMFNYDGTSFDFVRDVAVGFNGPTGVATYGSNRIIVADTDNNRVKVLDAQGNLLADYEAPNDGRTGTFNQPRGVLADKSARIIVADTGNGRVVTILDALPEWPPTGMTIEGPSTGLIETSYTFTSTVSPITATLPITYVWQANEQSPLTNTGALSDAVTFTWHATGTQVISVTASNGAGTATGAHAITIYTPVQAGFTAVPTGGLAPLTVVFTNTSSGDYTASLWSFGDSITSTLENPTHTYQAAGVFTVSLEVSGPGGSDEETKAGYVTVEEYTVYLPLVLSEP